LVNDKDEMIHCITPCPCWKTLSVAISKNIDKSLEMYLKSWITRSFTSLFHTDYSYWLFF